MYCFKTEEQYLCIVSDCFLVVSLAIVQGQLYEFQDRIMCRGFWNFAEKLYSLDSLSTELPVVEHELQSGLIVSPIRSRTVLQN